MNDQYEGAITTSHGVGAVELTIRELELALHSHRGMICTLIMFSAVSVLTGTMLLAGVVLALTYNGSSPSIVMLLCGALNTIAAGFLYLCLKPLSGKLSLNGRNYLRAA